MEGERVMWVAGGSEVSGSTENGEGSKAGRIVQWCCGCGHRYSEQPLWGVAGVPKCGMYSRVDRATEVTFGLGPTVLHSSP